MVAYLRQILVMLLVLLQVLAPLVHAHIGDDTDQPGLHLSEFEAWHVGQDDGLGLMAVDQQLQSQSAVVNIGAAIKHQPPFEQPATVLFLLGALCCLAARQLGHTVGFPSTRSRFAPSPLPSQHSSRAPPF